ncbi:MAG: DUF456 domain-containing protein [Bacteroidales bacterium]|nr:DUF456 domain-containing protein [Bacteroidales bacterium]
MDILVVFAIIAAVIGLIGSIVPGIPGPPVSWVGLLLAYFSGGLNGSGNPMSLTFLLVWLVIVIVVTVLDYVLPAWFTRVTGGHKAAAVGAIVGLFAGLFIPPVGMIAGSIIGAFLAELFVEDRGVWDSFKASMGAFLGFIFTTGMKFIVSGVIAYYIFVYSF